jgi:hypothetical protein
MVTVKSFQRRQTSEGKQFLVLQIEGDLQIQFSSSGRQYASVPKCNIPCSFDELTASNLIGTTMPGTIERIQCEPYNFTNPTTGEMTVLDFKYIYRPEVVKQLRNLHPLKEVIVQDNP